MKIKRMLTVGGLSVLLAGLALFLCLLDTAPDSGKIIGTTIIVVWAFCLIPAYVYAYDWLKKLDFSQGFRLGWVLGSLLFVLPLLVAPAFMVLFYLNLIWH